MSLIDSKYITPARQRNGVHYYSKINPDTKKESMAATFWNDKTSPLEPMCNECFIVPLWKTEVCPKCGGKVE